MPERSDDPLAIGRFALLEGSPPSYNNLIELDRQLQTITHIAAASDPAEAVPAIAIGTKHGNACGAGWRFVVEELRRVDAGVHLAEPAETSGLRGPKKRAKTDWADARHALLLADSGPAAMPRTDCAEDPVGSRSRPERNVADAIVPIGRCTPAGSLADPLRKRLSPALLS